MCTPRMASQANTKPNKNKDNICTCICISFAPPICLNRMLAVCAPCHLPLAPPCGATAAVVYSTLFAQAFTTWGLLARCVRCCRCRCGRQRRLHDSLHVHCHADMAAQLQGEDSTTECACELENAEGVWSRQTTAAIMCTFGDHNPLLSPTVELLADHIRCFLKVRLCHTL